ncbi:MAG: cobalamin-binding protein, partial [Candidatus Thermoplasmatota archaeon]|nr:cobalamin-binding protein [Candidatus Thermoplasmatota archaeon]
MAQRIVSLLPSATETLHAMGLGERLVARSHACDAPPAVLELPAAMRTRVDTRLTGQALDEHVRALVEAGEPLYVVDEGVLHHVQPDAIICQETCDVCAAGPADVHAALMRIEPVDRPELIKLHAHDLESALADMAH